GDPDARRLRVSDGFSGRAPVPRRACVPDLRRHQRHPAPGDPARDAATPGFLQLSETTRLMEEDDNKPLRGMRVYDATQGVAGPHATMLLALNGADVIKVEPIEGDWCRVLGNAIGQESVNYLAYNRGKRSMACDVKTAAGMEVARKLIATCDVFVESFRPGVIGRMGLGYDEVSKINPKIIYASVSGFGQTGP